MIKVSEGVASSTALQTERDSFPSFRSSVKRLLSSVRHYQRVVFPLSSFTSGLGLALLQLDLYRDYHRWQSFIVAVPMGSCHYCIRSFQDVGTVWSTSVESPSLNNYRSERISFLLLSSVATLVDTSGCSPIFCTPVNPITVIWGGYFTFT